jgi:catechol 2,3-dioxygenase-like lactoylglutathione lyase family enzyme
MSATLDKAFGYKGDKMNLPVADVAAAVPFYERTLGFSVIAQSDTPLRKTVLARDAIEMALVENGGDPSQDGCAFHVTGVEALAAEFNERGLGKSIPDFKIERHGDAAWKVFYVVAPDGLCYWFGERQP